jgi:hypothetical protein
MLIHNRLVSNGGWIDRQGVICFNQYREPAVKSGDPTKAGPWLELVHKVYPSDAAHIISWFAHRVQKPEEKVNHALVFGGSQGIGKDTLLEPVKYAVGPWNFREASPMHLIGGFNSFSKAVILRISEGRDLGDVNRFSFYEHTKIYAAAPPDVLRVNEKHVQEYEVFNCIGLIITTNHKTDGIYLPAEDRRHYVAWSPLTRDDFPDGYWDGIWGWYHNGGIGHVSAHLAELDLIGFNPKAPPPKTAAWWDIVDASRAPEDGELADVIDALGNPDALTLVHLMAKATGDTQEWLLDRKNRRKIPYRLEQCDYTPVRNDSAKDGLWIINGRRQAVYANTRLSIADRHRAASKL